MLHGADPVMNWLQTGTNWLRCCGTSYQLVIDLMHNYVKQSFCGSNVHCGSCSHAPIQYGVVFPQSVKSKRQLNCVMLTCVVMWLSRRVAARAIFLSFQIALDPVLLLFPYTTSTTGNHLGFERDYNYHTACSSFNLRI